MHKELRLRRVEAFRTSAANLRPTRPGIILGARLDIVSQNLSDDVKVEPARRHETCKAFEQKPEQAPAQSS